MNGKKMYRDKKNQKIAGVCAGIAKYFDMDPTVIRLLWVVLTLAGGSGVIAYLICMFIMPDEPDYTEADWTDANDGNS